MVSGSVLRLVMCFMVSIVGVIGLSAAPIRASLPLNQPVNVVMVVPYQAQSTVEEEAIQAYLAYANRDSSRTQTVITEAVVIDNYALLDWIYGEMGGQVVLQKQNEQWQILRGTGGLLGVQFMVSNGVPEATAQALWDAYQQKRVQRTGGVQ